MKLKIAFLGALGACLAVSSSTPAHGQALTREKDKAQKQDITTVGANGFDGDTPVTPAQMTPLLQCLKDTAAQFFKPAENATASTLFPVTVEYQQMRESRTYTLATRFIETVQYTGMSISFDRNIRIHYSTDRNGVPDDAPGALQAGFSVETSSTDPRYNDGGRAATAFNVTQTINPANLNALPTAFYTTGINGQQTPQGSMKPIPYGLVEKTIGGSADLMYRIQKNCAGLK